MFRYATARDRDELYALWQLCFHDTEAFANWFFSERFLPEYCAVWEENGHIACALHSLPLHIGVRDAVLPCAEIAGVATLPEYRGLGLMRATFSRHLAQLCNIGIPLIAYRPVDFAIYNSLHHYAIADKTFLTLSADAPRPILPDGYTVGELDARLNLTALHRFYTFTAKRYSGMIARSYADFALKYRDYASDGVRCAAVYREDGLAGYCFYYDGNDILDSIEILAQDSSAYTALCAYLAQTSGGRVIKLALPPDSGVQINGAGHVTQPRTAVGVTDVSALLRATDFDGFALEVRDDVIPANNGIYNLRGIRTNKKPQLTLDPGRLAQFIFGYASLTELASRGEAEIFDYSACSELDSVLPKKSCFCIDEY